MSLSTLSLCSDFLEREREGGRDLVTAGV